MTERMILATSNGTGLGHLTRQMCVALSMEDRADPIIFSLSRAVPVISEHGLRGEYCPSYDRDWMPKHLWQHYLSERLIALVAETQAKVVAFDGVVPHYGIRHARSRLPDVAFVWMRRGNWRPDINRSPLDSSEIFDLILEPGDLAAEGDIGPTAKRTDAIRLPPISMLEHIDPLPREEAARAVGLDPDRPTALVTLSSGVLNDVALPGGAAIEAFLKQPNWQVAVTRTALTRGGVPIGDTDRCVELQGVYPLVRYLHAFDAAVGAGGYNTVHELLFAAIPTLFVPNNSSTTDNQRGRSSWLADAGYALFADETRLDDVSDQTTRLCDTIVRKELSDACRTLEPPRGSADAVDQLVSLVGSYQPRTRRLGGGFKHEAKQQLKQVLGPKGTAVVRRLMGRASADEQVELLKVRITDDIPPEPAGTTDSPRPMVVTEDLSPDLLTEDLCLEHLLVGSSPEHRSTRNRTIDKYYEVV